jgi:hypothetical protein
MKIPAAQRFLGVPEGAPPRMLLGLPAGPLAKSQIVAALERQRQKIARHPAGREPDAERLLRQLEFAARFLGEENVAEGNDAGRAEAGADLELSKVAPVAPAAVRKALGIREPPVEAAVTAPLRPEPGLPTVQELTDFDREVLAALVACGGWNEESRSRLLEVAARHGVGSAGLTKVVLGMAEALRAGTLSPNQRARSAITDAILWKPVEPSRLAMAFEQLDQTMAREVSGDTPARLARLLAVFVGVGALAILALWWVLAPAPAPPAAANAPPAAASAEEIARRTAPPEVPAVEVTRPGTVRPARWSKPPSLKGGGPPDSVQASLREALRAPEVLASVARRLQLEANRPSAAIVRDWTASQKALAEAWPLLDATTRAAAIEAGVAALRQVESDDVAKQFLDAWVVEFPVADEPLGVWRGAWSAGMLAELATRSMTPAAVAAPAIDRLSVISRSALYRTTTSTVFDRAAGAWLDAAVRTIVTSTATDATSVDRWERWFEGQTTVRSAGPLQRAYVDAIGEVLESGLNITEEGRGSDLLGRLVSLVDWTERAPEQSAVRDAMTLWFASSRIGASRLWVLTSLLDFSYDTPWFLPEFVVDPEAEAAGRTKTLERILAAWPMPAGATTSGGIRVDSALLERWNAAFERAQKAPQNDDVERLRTVVALARLNAVAQAMSSGDVLGADAILDQTEEELATPPALAESSLTPGRRAGSDGEFTAAYEAAGRDVAKREDELRALRSRPLIGDLGPTDAETLVSEALRGSPNDVRDQAQTVLAERFDAGPTVLQELLDQLPSAPRNASVTTLLEQITRERLPSNRAEEWQRVARLALVRRLLALSAGSRHAIDALGERLAVAYAERGRLFRIGYEEVMVSISADAWMDRLVAQWRMKAGAMFLAEPFPAPLEEIDRRHGVRLRLADGPMQRCAAGQATLLELLATITVADRPKLKDAMLTILAESVARRARAGSVTEQLVEGERAIASVMLLLFEPTGGSSPSAEKAPEPSADAEKAAPAAQPSQPTPPQPREGSGTGIGLTEQRK